MRMPFGLLDHGPRPHRLALLQRELAVYLASPAGQDLLRGCAAEDDYEVAC